MNYSDCLRCAAIGSLVLGCSPLAAQTASSGTGNEDDDVVLLEAFQVDTDRDYGYVAVDSLAGGRVNTPLKLTPSSVSSLTSVFLEDLQITDVRQALKWAPSVTPSSPTAGSGFGGNAFHDWSFNYRNAGAGQQGGPGPSRNYFSFYQNADAYNVDRIEFLRGPNSLVFGLGTAGGTLTIYTKQARLDSDFTTLTALVDDNGSLRGEVDFNQAISDNLAVRVNAVADNHEGWQNNDNNRFRAATVAVLYKPFSGTSIRAEAEWATKSRSLFGTNIGDKTIGWDGQTSSATWGAAPTGPNAAYTQTMQAAEWNTTPFNVLNPYLESGQLQSWWGGYASTTNLPSNKVLKFQPYEGFYDDTLYLLDGTAVSTTDVGVLPSRDWTYGNGRSYTDYKDFTLTLDQQINSNMEFTVGAYYYDDSIEAKNYEDGGTMAIDLNQQLPNGQPNPYFGQRFADYFLSMQTQSREVSEIRAQLNYHFDWSLFNMPARQLFSVSAAYKRLEIEARQYLAQTVPWTEIENPSQYTSNMVWGRIYFDEDPNVKMEPLDGFTYFPSSGNWFDFDDVFKQKDVAFLSHTRLFDDSLSILAGVRYDDYTEDTLQYRKNADRTNRDIHESDNGTTYSIGGVYYFHWLGAFFNYSENIQPPNPGSSSMLDGSRPGPEDNTGMDYGLRISTPDHKYYATVTRYESESNDRMVSAPVDFRGIWRNFYSANPELADSDPLYTDRYGLAYSDTTARKLNGWEFELTANPTERIRLQASYALPETEVVDYYPDSRAYFSEFESTWTAGVATAETEELGDSLQTSIDNARNKLAQSLPGAIESGSVDYTFSMFANYTFIKGDPLEGLSIGAGMSKTGPRYAAVFNGEEYWGSSVTSVDAVIAYQTTLWGKETRFALNIDNLLDDNDPIITNYRSDMVDADGRYTVPDGWYMQAPRTFRFSMRVTL